MIQPNELRIGNLINVNQPNDFWNHSNPITVAAVLDDGVNLTMGDSTMYPSEECQGIPLTEEWLLKFGVEIMSNDKRVMRIRIEAGIDIVIDIPLQENGEPTNNARFKHVHQLQNLFFALTGKELELKKETV